jgi:N-acetylmuramoyl-L-alanine amidase
MQWLKELIDRIATIMTPPPPPKPVRLEVITLAKPKSDLEIPLAGARTWRGICWHHSASPDKPTRDWNGIVKYHTSHRVDFDIVTKEEFERRLQLHQGKVFEKPWKDVGYHAGTELVNGEPVFHWGRPLSMVGAHAGVSGVSNKFNEEYIGICCIGNYDPISPSPKLWEFNLMVTRALMSAFRISKENVIGHREVFDRLKIPRQKSCPGKSWNLDLFRAEL